MPENSDQRQRTGIRFRQRATVISDAGTGKSHLRALRSDAIPSNRNLIKNLTARMSFCKFPDANTRP